MSTELIIALAKILLPAILQGAEEVIKKSETKKDDILLPLIDGLQKIIGEDDLVKKIAEEIK